MGYICKTCGNKFSILEKRFRCDCGSPLDLEIDTFFSKKDLQKRGESIWRYREAYGLPADLLPVSLGEGRSPLLKRSIKGDDVLVKLDFLQPSGSFKDRGASVSISLANYIGVDRAVEDSSGNAGAAVSAYSAAAGIACTVFVPDYTPDGKLTQIRLYNANVVKVPGKRQDAHHAAMAAARTSFYASHIWSPVFVQGLASSAFEIWEQLGGRVPNMVIVPVGSGGYLEGLYQGFTLLKNAGYTRSIPQIIGVQALNCAPIHEAFQRGMDSFADVESSQTIAEGISVQQPARSKSVLECIRASKGFTIGVSEQEILEAVRTLFTMGIFAEPTSASVLAGWFKLEPKQRKDAVLLLTGSGLKQTKKLAELFPE
jgi:threonine synthase